MGFFTFGEIRTACGGEFNQPGVDPAAIVENVVTDSRLQTKQALFIALEGERFDGHKFLKNALENGAVLLLINRKKKEFLPEGAAALLVEDTLKAYQDLALFHRNRFPDLKLMALTGSYGKTSTKEILRSIFSKAAGKEHVLATEGNFNNQIGVPCTLLRLTAEHRYAIVEMGTNHFGEIAPLTRCARPQASLIVSIGNCHLEFLRDHDGVAQEKSEIFKAESVEKAVIPHETPQRGILEQAASHAASLSTFGKTSGATVQAIYHGGTLYGSRFELIHTPSGKRISVEWPLSGEHQAVNCAGAAALALEMGINLETIAQGVRDVTLPGARMRRTQHGDSFWINDAYNANPDSMCASLAALAEFADPAKTLLVLGDMGELGTSSQTGHGKVLSRASELFPGSRIIAVGPKMAQAVQNLEAEKGKFILAGSASEAAGVIKSLIRKGDLVFLKASHSMDLPSLEPSGEEDQENNGMDLKLLLKDLETITGSVTGNTEKKIRHVTMDSRSVKEGSLFCAIRGSIADGHDFLDKAVQNGAVCCVISADSPWQGPEKDFPVIRVTDSYRAWGILCETFMNKPAQSLKLFAVTGTNGKTTVTWLIRSILQTAYPDKKCGLVSTVEYDTASGTPPEESSRTTPDAMELQRLFAKMKEAKCTYAVMEQSSHGLHQFRAGSTRFEGGVFTNLTGDHLDYHGDMEHYYQAKKLLFTHMLREGAPAIVSVDNPGGERLFEELKKEKLNVCGVTLCGNPCADAFVKEIRMTPEGSAFTLTFEGKQLSIHTPLCGRFNICNVAEGLLLAWKTGIPETVLQKAAAEFQAPPGRLEKIFLPHRKAYAFVDYAHTDDALDQVLQTLSELSAGKKIITVFGCGGDRDRTKRPRMARAASVYSSEVILTRDNPRNENPSGIFEDIIQGFPDAYPFRIVEDRKEAIETALESAGEGDIVLIAGKGHEKYQEICGVRNHFDDRETVLQYLQKTMKNKTGEL